MEKVGEDRPKEELKCLTAIRCAKAALLLSSLKTATDSSSVTPVPQIEDTEIEMLKVELVKEIKKLKHIRCWTGVLLLSYLLLLTFLLVTLL